MRHIAAAVFLLTATSLNAMAADNPNASCPLLAREELTGLGVTEDTPFIDSDWKLDEVTPKELDGGMVVSNLCTVELHSSEGRTAIVLVVEHVNRKITEEQMENWLKAVKSQNNEEGVAAVKLGATECETGNYEIPIAGRDGEEPSNLNEFYVACDAQAGIRHVSLNVHVPEAKRTSLPSPEQVKNMLDGSIRRLKEVLSGQKT